MSKPWVDVVCLALPRNLAELSLHSFLAQFADRDQYRLRLIFHLDAPPAIDYREYKRIHRKPLTEATWQSVSAIAERFDDAVLQRSDRNQGFGGSLWNAMQHVRNRMLYCEDDKVWIKQWSMNKAMQLSDDTHFVYWICVRLRRPDIALRRAARMPRVFPAGSMIPGLWTVAGQQFLQQHFPPIHEHITERAMSALLGPHFKGVFYDYEAYVVDSGRAVGKSFLATKYVDRDTGEIKQVRGYDALTACGVQQ